jgi:branched chain amino acid efflux pump
MEALVNDAWWTVVLIGTATIAIKGAGPVLLGGRPLPERLGRVIGLLAPALLAALVAINTFGDGKALVLDARALGVGVAAVAIWFKAPPLLVIVLAAAVTALARALL